MGDGPTHGTKATGNDYQLSGETIAYLEEAGIGGVTRVRTNLAAIELLRTIQAEGRPATPEEKDQLAKYVGWGGWANDVFQPEWGDKTYKGIKERLEELLSPAEYKAASDSTPNAHYTGPSIVKAIYEAIERSGFKSGRVLDPSTGSGMFLGMMPREMAGGSQRVAVELDAITAQLAKMLYEATDVRHVGYEEFRAPPNYFDLVISDIRMPIKSGYEVLAAAKEANPNTPVIRTTGFGYDPNHSIIRARREGLAAVLFKPFKVDQLLNEIRNALEPAT